MIIIYEKYCTQILLDMIIIYENCTHILKSKEIYYINVHNRGCCGMMTFGLFPAKLNKERNLHRKGVIFV